jgi:predicted DNA-binding transcriptional regulator YafY
MVEHNRGMLETSARLLRLLALLQSRRDWTGAELADRLGVTARTVRNDVERLRRLGYPVLADRGNVGGYRLGAGGSLPPLLLDDEEAVAVVVGLRAAAGGAGGGAVAGITESAVRALAKLEQILPPAVRRKVHALAAHLVSVPPDRAVPTVDPELLTRLAALCRDQERLRFDCTTHAGTEAVRTVEPYQLVNWGRRWYLVAFDVDSQDWRTFRVDRIRVRTPTGPRFQARRLPADDLAAYVSSRTSAAAWRYRSRVTVHASAEYVLQRINPAVGTVEAIDDNSCVLDTGADTLDTLAVYLGMLDVDFSVTEPAELVEHVRALAARYARATVRLVDPPQG